MESITEILKHSNYYRPGSLVNDPRPMPGQSEPRCVYYWETGSPEYSIVMPVHDQQEIIADNLRALLWTTVGAYELIVVCDSCEDDTLRIVVELLGDPRLRVPGLCRIVVLEQQTPVFETTSDNMGFVVSRGKYILEVQADIRMITYGYNHLLCLPMRTDPNVLAVSGRCCHTFPGKSFEGKGKLGESIGWPLRLAFEDMNAFFQFDTCNRGPLALDREKLKDLGYLDEQNFVQSGDDHDLMLRALVHRGWRCGYVPIEFESPLAHGSTRKPQKASNTEFLRARTLRSDGGMLKECASTGLKPSIITKKALFTVLAFEKLYMDPR